MIHSLKILRITPLVFLLFFSCNSAQIEPAEDLNSKETRRGTETEDAERILISVPEDQRVLNAFNFNMDGDTSDEQILLLVSSKNQENPLVIQVIDYDTSRQAYFVLWEFRSLARGNWPHHMYLENLIGDATPEVLLRGQSASGQQTLEVIRVIWESSKNRASFSTVFQQQSSGTIEIRQAKNERDQDVSIIVQESENPSIASLDFIQNTYRWSFQAEAFQFYKTEKLSLPAGNNTQFQRLLQQDTPILIQNLEGPWFMTDGTKGEQIIFFDTQKKNIVMYKKDSQEVYLWDITSRGQRNGLYIRGSNELVPHIKIQFYLQFTDTDSLQLSTQEAPDWTGNYERLTETLQRAMAIRSDQGLKLLPNQLSGLYKDEGGTEINFEFPLFSMIENHQRVSGSASIFTINDMNVLQLKIIRDNGRTLENRAYRLELQEGRSNQRIIRIMTLWPGKMTAKAFKEDLSDPLILEQTELLTD